MLGDYCNVGPPQLGVQNTMSPFCDETAFVTWGIFSLCLENLLVLFQVAELSASLAWEILQ